VYNRGNVTEIPWVDESSKQELLSLLGNKVNEFLSKGRGKLRTMVQDHLVMKTKMGEDMFKK